MKRTDTARKGYHFRHIRTRLLFSYALILIIPCLILGIVFLGSLDRAYSAQQERETYASMEVLGENLKSTLSGLSNVLADGCSNIDLWYYLCHSYRYPESSINGYYGIVRPLLDNYRKMHPEIVSAHIYTTNRDVVTNNHELCRLEDNSWEAAQMQRLEQERRVWLMDWRSTPGQSALMGMRIMRLYGKTVGVFCLQLDQKKLLSLMGEGGTGSISLVQSGGYVLLSTAGELTGQTLDTAALDNNDLITLEGRRQKVFTIPFQVDDGSAGWLLMRTIPLDEIDLVARVQMSYLILLGVSMIILMIVLSVVFSFGMTTRLSEIRHVITDMQSGDFSVRIPVRGDDEIADLAVSFNQMLERLEGLVAENARISTQKKEAELTQREAQLNALQSQINPHFLFNALEAIQYGIRDNPVETEHVLQMLARNLRRLASWEREKITLQEELHFVEEYLQIQRFRYGERLHYTIEVDERLRQLEIPNLLLQPLVENAVIHGVAMKAGGGTVSVSARDEGGQIVFTVHDDGAGMTELEQEELRQSLSRPTGAPGPCIGLKNVYDRLTLCYGGRARFVWESSENHFTTMRILLEKEDAHARDDRG